MPIPVRDRLREMKHATRPILLDLRLLLLPDVEMTGLLRLLFQA
jgi:hypothetical protein